MASASKSPSMTMDTTTASTCEECGSGDSPAVLLLRENVIEDTTFSSSHPSLFPCPKGLGEYPICQIKGLKAQTGRNNSKTYMTEAELPNLISPQMIDNGMGSIIEEKIPAFRLIDELAKGVKF